jgi:hypothetical protein
MLLLQLHHVHGIGVGLQTFHKPRNSIGEVSCAPQTFVLPFSSATRIVQNRSNGDVVFSYRPSHLHNPLLYIQPSKQFSFLRQAPSTDPDLDPLLYIQALQTVLVSSSGPSTDPDLCSRITDQKPYRGDCAKRARIGTVSLSFLSQLFDRKRMARRLIATVSNEQYSSYIIHRGFLQYAVNSIR